MSTIKVNNIVPPNVGEGVSINGLQMPTDGPLSNRSLIINGAMQVAQRGTSSTAANYSSVDRFESNFNGGAVTQSQGTLTNAAADAAVYNLGFRHYFRQTNTTAAPGNSDHRNMRYRHEAQDVATSGWNYTSSTSYVTLSFWVRSSVAQEFYGYVRSEHGTTRIWTFSTGALVADEWTKIEKTIPGDSLLEFPNDNTSGLQMFIVAGFWGAVYTDASITLDTWRNYDSALRTPVYTNTWASTANATLDITGIQFEVGSKATPFEHESYGQTLAKCMRYFQIIDGTGAGGSLIFGNGATRSANNSHIQIPLGIALRDKPTLSVTNTIRMTFNGNYRDSTSNSPTINGITPAVHTDNTNFNVTLNYNGSVGYTIGANQSGVAVMLNTPGTVRLDSEL